MWRPFSIGTPSSQYFKSRADQLIFALIYMDGRQRMDALRVKKIHYYSKDTATVWRNNMRMVIENSGLPGEQEALDVLGELYYHMTDYGEEDDDNE